jgi:hypothetical protein
MWFIFFEKLNGEIMNTIAVHTDCVKAYIPKGDETSNWLVTEQPLDYNPNYLYDRNGKIFALKLLDKQPE